MHSVISRICDFVCLSVCVCDRAVKGKWLELSASNLTDIWQTRHILILRSRGQRFMVHNSSYLLTLPAPIKSPDHNLIIPNLGHWYLRPSGMRTFGLLLLQTLHVVLSWPWVLQKHSDQIEMSFRILFYVGSRNHILDGGPDPPHAEGNLWE